MKQAGDTAFAPFFPLPIPKSAIYLKKNLLYNRLINKAI